MKVKVEPAQDAPPSPSEELLKAAMLEETITDGRGRKLHMRKPGVLAQYRLIEALGDLAANQIYMQMVNPLLYLGSIDGDPVFVPASKLEAEALIERLDEDGLASVMTWYMVNVMKPTADAIDAAEKAAREKAAVKN